MHVTFNPQDFEAGHLNRAWSTLVSNHFLESCHIKKKAFYSSLDHSSIPVQYSSPAVQSTNSRQPCTFTIQKQDYTKFTMSVLPIK